MKVFRPIVNFLLTLFQWNSIRKDTDSRIFTETVDTRVLYVLTTTKRFGLAGFGDYLASPVLIIETEQQAAKANMYLADYIRFSSTIMTGSRRELLRRVKGIGVLDFANARSIKEHINNSALIAVRATVATIDNPQAVFTHWLKGRIETGVITSIDGYHFINGAITLPNTPAIAAEDFLPKFYSSYKLAAVQFNLPRFDTLEIFAREMLFNVMGNAMGLDKVRHPENLFPRVNEMLRAHADQTNLPVEVLENQDSVTFKVRELASASAV